MSYIKQGKGEIYIHSEIPPICSSDGFYAQIQVNKQNINQRYCSDRYGKRIEEFSQSLDMLSGRKMNCECALSRHYSINSKPKCCDNGNFRPMQCMGGLCYCVDQYGRQIGEEIEQTKSDQLPCSESNIEYKKNDFCCDLGPYSIGQWCFEPN